LWPYRSAVCGLDVGRLIMVPPMAVALIAELSGLEHHGVSSAVGVLRSGRQSPPQHLWRLPFLHALSS
jgi:hypothetical protein